MQAVELMVFDLDGTLVDSAPDLVAAGNFTRRALNLPGMDARVIMSMVGDGTDKLVERLIGPEHQDLFSEAMTLFMNYYENHLLDNTVLYPGVLEVLHFFSCKRKAMITNKRDIFTRTIADHFHIADHFDVIVGVGKTSRRKPDALVLLPILERYHVDPDLTVVIGDGIADMNLAKNAGVKSCAVLNGFTPRDVLLALNPDFVCEELRDLKDIFC